MIYAQNYQIRKFLISYIHYQSKTLFIIRYINYFESNLANDYIIALKKSTTFFLKSTIEYTANDQRRNTFKM